jgi:hypothetical protein
MTVVTFERELLNFIAIVMLNDEELNFLTSKGSGLSSSRKLKMMRTKSSLRN